jgi:hypothetical protein
LDPSLLLAAVPALGAERTAAAESRSARRRPSAKARAARKAQGRYLGAVRLLSAANRAKVKAIREKKGIRAAITAAKKLVK